ncbi:hypothetical protein OIU77_009682 [Salix suchowensis]|uniref:Uncharacterized protein n=1 Tax=Salix suchowensis TaxID=1278906 RepID=A0ABQ9AH36_9ROSI|nr:hypothetical protein OIU77_009682 [Salix suchowensis]
MVSGATSPHGPLHRPSSSSAPTAPMEGDKASVRAALTAPLIRDSMGQPQIARSLEGPTGQEGSHGLHCHVHG